MSAFAAVSQLTSLYTGAKHTKLLKLPVTYIV